MSKKIIFQKATRIEGNANIQIEIADGHVQTARFLVHEFRGFEGFLKGIRVENIPHLVSRICGLCSCSHQVASIAAIEDALGVQSPVSVKALRQILVLGEWISSHALSYFFLTMPDFVGAQGGVFELMETHPEITREAFALRQAGLNIVQLLGKRSSHPVTIGIGRFSCPPTHAELEEIRIIAYDVKERISRVLHKAVNVYLHSNQIPFPPDQQINFVSYDSSGGQDAFYVHNRMGELLLRFTRDEFLDNISELRADWTLAKFPYLTEFGFPDGIMLVGPLSRSFQENGPLSDPSLAGFDITSLLKDRKSLTLESYDACRLVEILWASQQILDLLGEVDLSQMTADVDLNISGQGIGVIEAPRGILMHSYLINQGRMERMRLLVATQFNNAYINMLLRDIAERHIEGDGISQEGEKLIGRCVRMFDPCLSCATH
jgi:coenzyme F420-reducing hydrogenase alpha subunit